MARPFKYYLYLVGLYFLAITPLQAQYSEQTLLNEANALFEKEQYADAMPKYAQLLSLNPTSPELNYKYGATSLFGDASKKAEASKYLKFAVGKTGVDALSWYFLGRAHHLNYQFADAVKAYEKYVSLASSKDVAYRNVSRQIEACKSGQNLLNNIKEVVVLDKKQSTTDFFFRLYDLSDIGGKILVTPDELLTSQDKKRNHKSLIHFRGIGTTVYFSSYGKDGKNGLDIYQAEVLPDGSFSTPVAISGGVNTPNDEDFPFLHPDNKTFYFSSTGHNSMGGYDVFRSAFDRNQGVFSKPENLDFAVNTPDDDIFYIADSLNNLANFASARSSKQGEMHVYKVEVKSLPLELTLLKGSYANKIEPANRAAKITVVNAATNKQVDVQYTDPATGDYVLSFPKSGKYKFLVEAKSSEMIHSGIVDVPPSDGISAYLQEMELVKSAGVEKLLINNLFDQQYQGDIAELMQNLLRQKAALEINFEDIERPAEPEVLEEPDQFAMAYSAAGFGAGMTNEKVLEEAEKRVSEYSSARLEIENLASAAAAQSSSFAVKAEEEIAKAEQSMAKANAAQGSERDAFMFQAAVAKYKAEDAIRSAQNARKLEEKLISYEKAAKVKQSTARAQVDSLEFAINSGDFDTAVAALKREGEVRAGIDKVTDRFDPLNEVRLTSVEAQNAARRKMESATNLRVEAETLQSQWLTKKRQREKVSGKQAEKLDLEIAALVQDIADLKLATTRAFDEAEKYQLKANQEQEQYDILASLGSDESGTLQKAKGVSPTGTDEKLNALASRSQQLSPDKESVANYMASNPGENFVSANDGDELAFRKAYMASPETDKATLETAADLAAEGPAVSEKAQIEIAEKDNTEPSGREISNNQVAVLDQTSTDTGVQEKGSVSSGNATEEANQPKEVVSEQPTELADASVLKSGAEKITEKADPIAETAVVPTVNPVKVQPELAVALAENTEELTLPEPGTPEAKTRIQAEQVKIQASQDWIAIIDESIEALESGMGGDDTDEVDMQAQLEQYRQLKIEKMKEVESSNALIVSLTLSDADEMTALARAESDIDTLDASMVARLESKILDAYVQGGYVANVNNVDRDYLSKMTSVEMSGKSAPEIAAQRIALNEELIADIEKVMSKEVFSEISETDALELRRIKTLEVQMDRDILNGSVSFEPRTAQAIEYRALLAEKDSKSVKPKNDERLSPEISEALSLPYSRDVVLQGYEASLSAALSNESEKEKLESRIELNESFAGALDSELTRLGAAMAAQEGAVPEELNERYQLLQLERSNAAEQIQEDREKLLRISANDLSDSGAEQQDQSPEISEKDYASAYTDRVAEVKLQQLSKEDELVAIAEVNRQIHKEINLEIERLMPILDAANEDAVRDEVQIRIQELDAMAADKLQEADRLDNEADVLSASFTSNLIADSDNKDDEVVPSMEFDQDISPDDLKFSIDQRSDYQLMEYKSLNANIQYSQLQASIDSANTYRGRAREILELYNEEKEPESRKALYDEFVDISKRITSIDQIANEELSRSNQAEIDFYNSASDQLTEKLNKEEMDDSTRTEVLRYQQEIEAVKKRIESNRELIESLDPSETASRAALIAEERTLISQLGESYTAMVKVDKLIQASILEENTTAEVKEQALNTSDAVQLESADSNDLNSNESEDVDASIEEGLTADPNEKMPLPGKVYTTPMRMKYAEGIPKERLKELTSNNPELAMEFDLSQKASQEQWSSLITSMTAIDAQGLDILRESPEKLSYLSTVLAADTLRTLENAKATYADRISKSAGLQVKEAERLRGMLKYQTSQSEKVFINEKADKLMSEAEISYQKSAIAALQAEEIRSARIAQEQLIASKIKALNETDLAELNAFVDLPAYSVVQMDLTSAEPAASVSNTRTGRKPEERPEAISLIDRAKSETSESKASVPGSISGSSSPSEGNWLAMVEVVAEKKNFSDVKETMFVSVDAPVYSASNPIPIDPDMPSGLIFQVQVGAFRNPIPQEHFKEFAPVMGQRLDNGITRYRAGIFRKYKEAIVARNGIRDKGYSDAFVVAYLNGEKLTGTQAEQILAQARLAENFTAGDEQALSQTKGVDIGDPVPVTTTYTPGESTLAQPRSDYYNDPEAAEAVQVEVVSGLFFTVQVGVYSKPVRLSELYNLSNLNSELTANGMIRYTTGRFASISDAGQMKQNAINAGVEDAFITAYNNGVRINLQEASSLLNTKGEAVLSQEVKNQRSVAPELTKAYVVFVGQFESVVPQDLANILLENVNLNIRSVKMDGLNTYISNTFENLSEARIHLAKCEAAGIEDASIMELDAEKLLPLTEK